MSFAVCVRVLGGEDNMMDSLSTIWQYWEYMRLAA